MLAGIAAIAVTTGSMSAFADEVTTGTGTATVGVPTASVVPTAVGTGVERPTTTPDKKTAFDFKKIIPAMQAREDAIANSWVTEFEAKQLALLNRRIALMDAYNMTDKKMIKSAVKAAHKAFHDAKSAATKNGIIERKAAWETFRKEVKALKTPVTNQVEGMSESSKDQE